MALKAHCIIFIRAIRIKSMIASYLRFFRLYGNSLGSEHYGDSIPYRVEKTAFSARKPLG